MDNIISLKEFAEKMRITEAQAARVIRKNKWAAVKVKGIRSKCVNMDRWNEKNIMKAS